MESSGSFPLVCNPKNCLGLVAQDKGALAYGGTKVLPLFHDQCVRELRGVEQRELYKVQRSSTLHGSGRDLGLSLLKGATVNGSVS